MLVELSSHGQALLQSYKGGRTMTTHRSHLVLVIGIALSFALSCFSFSAQGADNLNAIIKLEKLGAKFERDEKSPERRITLISFFGKPVKDEDLAYLVGFPDLLRLDLIDTEITDARLVHLKALTKLEALDLGYSKITDAGLVHLKGLTSLKELNLGGREDRRNAILGDGLVHLENLTKLEDLLLNRTELTDSAVVHLKEMKTLKFLAVRGTDLSAKGLNDLQKSLPRTRFLIE